MFRLFCGDSLIDSYTEGAFLVFSVKISFADHTQKDSYVNTFGASFGPFANIGFSIKSEMD